MKILVTGAGGFIGGSVVELFHLNGIGNVRAGLRRWSSAARIGRFPVEIVLCDILEENQVDAAVMGVDAVVHCAYGSADVTIKGTETMLASSLKHGVKRFVHLSTIDVYGHREGEIDETSPFQENKSEYGDSKIQAERLCQQYYSKGLPVVILRPTIVYGPFCNLWIVKFAERLQSGSWGLFEGFGEGTCNLVYINDLVEAIHLSLDSKSAPGEALNINGSEEITWNGYFRSLNDSLGLPDLKLISPQKSKARSVMKMPLRFLARYARNHFQDFITRIYRDVPFAKWLMKTTEQSIKTTPSLDELHQYSRKATYSIAKAKSILGYEPRFTLDEGMRLSAGWLSHESGRRIESELTD